MLKMYLTPTQQIQNSIGNQIINHLLSLCFSDSLCLSLFSLTSLFSLLYGKTCIHTRMTFTLTNPSLQNLCFMHPKRGFPDCVFSTFLCVSFPVLSRSKIFQQQEKKKSFLVMEFVVYSQHQLLIQKCLYSQQYAL